jgi:aldose 1-epimerase
MALTGKQFQIAAGGHTATVVEVGGGLRSYSYDAIDVTAPYAEDETPPRGDGGVLVPWPNRLRDGRYTFDGHPQQLAITEVPKHNAIHGLARWARWQARDHEESSVTMAIDLVPQTGWPFEVRVEVTYALRPQAGLSVTIRAINNGATPAPFGAGFHPYLSTHGHRLDDVTLRVPARQHLLVDDAQVPVGARSVGRGPHDLRRGRRLRGLRLDDGFADLVTEGGRGRAEVRTAAGSAEVWFDEAFRYLQVFTVDDLHGGQSAVAIEPMTCPADAFNTGEGLIVLAPQRPWTASWGIRPLVDD